MTAAPAGSAGRDAQIVDALTTDRYLDAILAAHGRGADAGPIPASAVPDLLVRTAAERLARDLPRFHPSFRFEEALAARLSQAAARMRLPLAIGGVPAIGGGPFGGVPAIGGEPFDVVPIRDRRALPWTMPSDEDRPSPRPDAAPTFGRPLLIGGALTSAALSIAGAAYVAWRIRRAPRSPMARAVRAVARTKLA